jgi:dCMP deaminase
MDWHEYFLRHVYLAASKSKDPKTKIGAVLVRGHNIISTGYNGFPIGVSDLPERYNERETKYKFVCHAEANSVLSSARFGILTKDSALYSQGVPCHECAKTLIQAGISNIFVHRQWPNLIHVDSWVKSIEISRVMFQEANIPVMSIDRELGITGFLDGKTINV